MIKFPSLQTLWQGSTSVIRRFPFEMIFTVCGTAAMILMMDYRSLRDHSELLVRTGCFSLLGLLMTLSATLYSETHITGKLNKIILVTGAAIVAIVLGFLIDPFTGVHNIQRILFLLFAFHLLVAFAPFVSRGSLNGFWQFNKTLFLRFATSALYSGVLYVGLVIALISVDHLFDVNIRGERYSQLWFLIAGIFNTMFFLAGIPADLKELDQETSYPKGLKIFTQYVLIPLTSIYFLILFAYEIKILSQWQLPQGYVSTLILGYAVFGILSLLLVYPVRDKEDSRWIKIFSKSFYILMIPLIVLLMLAVWKRVGDYGITESRYILTLLSLWLVGITAYFISGKTHNIKVIPVTLFILALLSVYGPQSAGSVSLVSQRARLTKLLSAKKKDNKEIVSIVEYIIETHGIYGLQDIVHADLAGIETHFKKKIKYRASRDSYRLRDAEKDSVISILKIDKSALNNDTYYQSFISDGQPAIDVRNTDYVVRFSSYGNENGGNFSLDKKNFNMQIEFNSKIVLKSGSLTLTFATDSIFNTLLKNTDNFSSDSSSNSLKVPERNLTIIKHGGGYTFTCVLEDLSGYIDKAAKDKRNNMNFSGNLLIKKD